MLNNNYYIVTTTTDSTITFVTQILEFNEKVISAAIAHASEGGIPITVKYISPHTIYHPHISMNIDPKSFNPDYTKEQLIEYYHHRWDFQKKFCK